MIAHQGFLRQFMTESKTGKGVCFSSDATTARERAEADRLGMRRIFLCRALVGHYHKGYQGCILPDPKPGQQYKVHESVVDNVFKPKFFVLFQDDQAYPEYCITFRDVVVEVSGDDDAKRSGGGDGGDEEDEASRKERADGKETETTGDGREEENKKNHDIGAGDAVEDLEDSSGRAATATSHGNGDSAASSGGHGAEAAKEEES
mmetsp:Transcript_13767/g.26114  ORF Transcript_13767/g.26114 Transcript_13767/m.26114 type:complete len:205 (+) Transcript_13767:107-721(+)